MEDFQAADVLRICNVKRNRLQSWLEKGWIVPSIQKASGHGTRNIFSKPDLYKIALFRQAVESGISRAAVAEFLPGVDDVLNSLDGMSISSGASLKGNKRSYVMAEIRMPSIAFLRHGGGVVNSYKVIMGNKKTDFPVFTHEWDDIVVINLWPVIHSVESKL